MRDRALRALAATVRSQARIEQRMRERVLEARRQQATWQEIADILGMSRGSAHFRFRDVDDEL